MEKTTIYTLDEQFKDVTETIYFDDEEKALDRFYYLLNIHSDPHDFKRLQRDNYGLSLYKLIDCPYSIDELEDTNNDEAMDYLCNDSKCEYISLIDFNDIDDSSALKYVSMDGMETTAIADILICNATDGDEQFINEHINDYLSDIKETKIELMNSHDLSRFANDLYELETKAFNDYQETYE